MERETLLKKRDELKKELKKIESKINQEIPINNLTFVKQNIKLKNKIDAEHFATGYFKEKGFKVFYTSKYKETLKYWVQNPLKSPINNLILIKTLRSINEDRLGRPDLCAVKENDFFFIEVKTNGDGLRIEQIEWILRYPKLKVVLFYLNQRK